MGDVDAARLLGGAPRGRRRVVEIRSAGRRLRVAADLVVRVLRFFPRGDGRGAGNAVARQRHSSRTRGVRWIDGRRDRGGSADLALWATLPGKRPAARTA